MEDDYGPSTSYRGRGYSRRNSYGRGYQDRSYQGGRSNGYRDDQYHGNGRGNGYRGRSSWGQNSGGSRGRGRGRGRGFEDPKNVQYLRVLRGHENSVTDMVFDNSGSQADMDRCSLYLEDAAGDQIRHQDPLRDVSLTMQLYTGSKDGSVRVWDYNTGQLSSQEDIKAPSVIKVFNTQSGNEDTLEGLVGPVMALAAGSNMLFSGSQDAIIRIWEFSQEHGKFVPKVALNGHEAPISSLCICGSFLFSADFKGNIKVWDLTSGQCTQTLPHVHSHVIMSLLPYKSHILSGSVDASIRVWMMKDPPEPGAVLISEPMYTHPPPDTPRQYGKVLAMHGTTGPDGQDILLSSTTDDVVQLWQLPDFADRGHLNAIRNCRTIVSGQGHIFAGDYNTGNVKVWKWNAN